MRVFVLDNVDDKRRYMRLFFKVYMCIMVFGDFVFIDVLVIKSIVWGVKL